MCVGGIRTAAERGSDLGRTVADWEHYHSFTSLRGDGGVASQGGDDALGAVPTSGDEAPLWGLRLSVLSDAHRDVCHYVCVLSEHADEP